jgi:hypothetical protein
VCRLESFIPLEGNLKCSDVRREWGVTHRLIYVDVLTKRSEDARTVIAKRGESGVIDHEEGSAIAPSAP